MIYAQGIVEYAVTLGAIVGSTFTSLTGFEPTLNLILLGGGVIFFFFYLFVAYKL
jgi:hypothetical protein